MKKLQQFYVYKFNSDYLRFKNYNLTCDINEARRNKWLVSLADSQALRTIRRIRYSRNSNIIQFDQIRLDENKKRKKRLLKEKYTRIREIFNEQKPYIGLYNSYYAVASSWSLKGSVTANWYNIFIDIDNWYKN